MALTITVITMIIRGMLYECELNCIYCKANLVKACNRFFQYVNKSGDCWEWMSSKDPNGYGKFSFMGESVFAHRYSYALHRPLDKDLTLDHLCRNTGCINPNHLEQVTSKVNTFRAPKHIVHGDGVATKRTHCKNGHEMTRRNIYDRNGIRRCRICRLAWGVRRKAKIKQLPST